MRRLDPDVLAGTLVTLLSVAVGVPILLAQLAGDGFSGGSAWAWWLTYGGFLVVSVASTWGLEVLARRWLVVVFAVQVVLGAALVLLAPSAGFLPILLVMTAALSCYVVGRRTTAAIVVLHTVVVAVAAGLAGAEAVEIGMVAFLYAIVHGLSVSAVIGQQRVEVSAQQLAAAHVELRAASALLADSSRANERLRIARDLHDVVGHQLTALSLELEVASHHSTPPASEHVTRSRRIAKEMLADVRQAVGDLRGEAPDLRTTLTGVVADLPSPRVHLSIADDLDLGDEPSRALVRCVQEIVTNTIRHAGARNLWIDISAGEDGEVRLRSDDDGRGAGELRLGNGLRGMRERLEALGGSVRFASEGGFHVVAQVPAR